MENLTLQHHGTKGMKWGVRRFQNKNGSLTPLGRLRRKRYEKQLAKQRIENLEKARQARAAKKEHEANKQKVLQSGSAKEVLKYRGELTQQEMDAAFRRIQWEQTMQSISAKEVSAGKSKVNKTMDTIGDLTTKANTIIKAYNTVANVVNALNSGPMLPKISTDINNDNREARRKEKKEKDNNKQNQDNQQNQNNQANQNASKQQKAAKEKETTADTQTNNTKSNKQATDSKSSGPEVFTGTVEGKGASKQQKTAKPQNDDVIIDVDWTDVTVSEAKSSSYASIGQDYVMYLLEDKSK